MHFVAVCKEEIRTKLSSDCTWKSLLRWIVGTLTYRTLLRGSARAPLFNVANDAKLLETMFILARKHAMHCFNETRAIPWRCKGRPTDTSRLFLCRYTYRRKRGVADTCGSETPGTCCAHRNLQLCTCYTLCRTGPDWFFWKSAVES